MIGDVSNTKLQGYNAKCLMFLAIWLVIFAPVFMSYATACSVTKVDLYVRRLPTDEWATEATLCMGETAYFKAECQVGDDTEGRPIKWIFTYGDGNSDTKWTDNSTSGPESGGTYIKYASHTYFEYNTNENEYHEVEVRAQRVDPDTGSPIGDWESDTCKVTVVRVNTIKYQDGSEWIDRNLCVTKGTTVTFKAIPLPSDATWPSEKPVWSGSSGASGTGETTTVTFNDLGSYLEVTATCCSSSFSRLVTVQDVKFIEDENQSYGFDDWTSPDYPWKSVKEGEGGTDTAKAEIVHDPVNNVYFKSVTESKVTRSPSQASSSPQTITFGGVEKGESEIQANAGSVDGSNLAKMKAKVYISQSPLTVKVITIKEDSSSTVYLPEFMTGLQAYLNEEVFDQCVTGFTVAPGFNITEVNYDLDENGKLNYPSDAEAQAIKEAAEDTGYDYNIFVVSDIEEYDTDGDGELDDVAGFANCPGRCSWVEYNANQRTVAHELAHALGGLDDITDEGEDDQNLMSYHSGGTRWRLRKGQWDSCNQVEEE